jgi:hypothetical protein
VNYLEVLIYLSPELLPPEREKVRRTLLARAGVMSANFDPARHPHVMVIQYSPGTVRYTKLLEEVKCIDPLANLAPVSAWRRKHLMGYIQESVPASA